MGIEYIDKTHAKLVVTKGSGSNRERKVKRITYTSKKDAKSQFDEFEKSISFTVDYKLTISNLLEWYIGRFEASGGKKTMDLGILVPQCLSAKAFLSQRYLRILGTLPLTSHLKHILIFFPMLLLLQGGFLTLWMALWHQTGTKPNKKASFCLRILASAWLRGRDLNPSEPFVLLCYCLCYFAFYCICYRTSTATAC